MVYHRLFINSNESVDLHNEDPHNFTASLDSALSNFYFNLASASVVYTPVYPSIPDYEKRFSITRNGTDFAFNVDTSYYYFAVTGSDTSKTYFINELNTKASDAGCPFGFEWDDRIKRVYMTGLTQSDSLIFKSDCSLYRRIGIDRFNVGKTNFITATGQYIMPNPPNIVRTTGMYITSGNLTQNAITDRQGAEAHHDMLCFMPVSNHSYGTIIPFVRESHPHPSYVSQTVQNIRFEILDDLYNPLELERNAQVNIELFIDYPEDSQKKENLTEVPIKPNPIKALALRGSRF